MRGEHLQIPVAAVAGPRVARSSRTKRVRRLVVEAAGSPAERDANRIAAAAVRSPHAAFPSTLAETRLRRSPDAAGPAGGEVDADTDSRIRRAQGHGAPLLATVREPMETTMGRDFGRVHVHADTESHELNRRVGARAFTVGNDVFLGKGENVNDTRTMAHELAHVAQHDGGVQRIRRLIGFEYELNTWRTLEVDDPTDVVTLTNQVPVAKGYIAESNRRESHWKRLPKGAVLAESGDVEVTADDWGSESDLELRTKAIDETDALKVTATAQQLADVAGHATNGLAARYQTAWGDATPHQLRASELGLTTKNAASFLMPALANMEKMDVKGKIQATTGVRLGKLPDLIRNIFADTSESGTARGRRKEGRKELAGFDQDTAPKIGPIMSTMGAAPGKATAALVNYQTTHKNAPPPSPELEGLLALLIAYMDMAKNGLVRSYSKTIAPVMARTDFATMFATLKPAERDYYAKKSGKNFSDLLIAAGYSKKELDKSIYSAGISESQEPNEWYRDLKRKDWLRAIPSKAPKAGKTDKIGKDKLTPANYPTKRGRQAIEGLGSYGKKTDTVTLGTGPPLKVPIVELRSLPDMGPNEFVDFAQKIARLITFLNSDQDKTYGET